MVCYLDLETVVEPWWKAPEYKPDAFPPPAAWRVICAGLVVHRGASFEAHVFSGDERDILLAVSDVATCPGPVVTWHGTRFDMPILRVRSMKHGVNQAGLFYMREHYDLALVLHGHLADTFAALELPAKEVHGGQVAQMYAEGRIADIERYCITDVIKLAIVRQRELHVFGAITDMQQHAREAELRVLLQEHSR